MTEIRLTSEALLPEFRSWLETAGRPLALAVTAAQVAVASADGSRWVLSRRQEELVAAAVTAVRESTVPVWSPNAVEAVRKLAPVLRVSAAWFNPWLRCATTAVSVAQPGEPHWTRTGKGAPRGASRVALATAGLMRELQASTVDEVRSAVLVGASQEQLWRPRHLTGWRVDAAALSAKWTEMSESRARLKVDLGVDFCDGSPAGDAAGHRWLARYGISVTDSDGQPSLSSDHFDRAVVPDTPMALSAWAAFRQARRVYSRLAKVRELERAMVDGRVFSSLGVYAQRAGRSSSTRPALQNIAKDSRPLMVAEPGNVLVGLDYDQFEVRVAAALSGDERLAADVASGDIYLAMARRLGRPEGQRPVFKRAFLATVYGQGARSLSRTIGSGIPEAQEFISHLWAGYPDLHAFAERAKAAFGSRQLLWSGRPAAPKAAYSAPNAWVQGTAADVLYAATGRVAAELGNEVLWLPLHDELIVEVPRSRVEGAREALNAVMPTTLNGVPITGTATVMGGNWSKD